MLDEETCLFDETVQFARSCGCVVVAASCCCLQWISKWELQRHHGCRCTHLPTWADPFVIDCMHVKKVAVSVCFASIQRQNLWCKMFSHWHLFEKLFELKEDCLFLLVHPQSHFSSCIVLNNIPFPFCFEATCKNSDAIGNLPIFFSLKFNVQFCWSKTSEHSVRITPLFWACVSFPPESSCCPPQMHLDFMKVQTPPTNAFALSWIFLLTFQIFLCGFSWRQTLLQLNQVQQCLMCVMPQFHRHFGKNIRHIGSLTGQIKFLCLTDRTKKSLRSLVSAIVSLSFTCGWPSGHSALQFHPFRWEQPASQLAISHFWWHLLGPVSRSRTGFECLANDAASLAMLCSDTDKRMPSTFGNSCQTAKNDWFVANCWNCF